METNNILHHFQISKSYGYATHVVLNDDCEIVSKHSRNIFTKAGNYTSGYLQFLAQYGLNRESVDRLRKTAESVERAQENLRVDKCLEQIDALIENPETAPNDEFRVRLQAIDDYLENKGKV